MAAKLALELFHGRESPTATLNDWGSQGPVFLVEWFRATYCWDLRIGLDTPEGEGSLEVIDGLLYYDGVFYGDWTIHPIEALAQSEGLACRLEDFDPVKACRKHPQPTARSL